MSSSQNKETIIIIVIIIIIIVIIIRIQGILKPFLLPIVPVIFIMLCRSQA